MSRPIKFCEEHQCDRKYYPRLRKYRCTICQRERMRHYYLVNLGSIKTNHRRWYLLNKEKVLKDVRAWRKANPLLVRNIQRKAEKKYRSSEAYRDHDRYYHRSRYLTIRLASMSDPCAILRDV